MCSCPTSDLVEWEWEHRLPQSQNGKETKHQCTKLLLSLRDLLMHDFKGAIHNAENQFPPIRPLLTVPRPCLKVTFITLPTFSINKLCIYQVSRLLRNEKSLHFASFTAPNILKLCAKAGRSGIWPFVMSRRTVIPQRCRTQQQTWKVRN